MRILNATAATIAMLAIGSTCALAQTDMEKSTTTQKPSNMVPAPSSAGTSTGESGVTAPAGNPSDPTTEQNQQPGMSPHNPSDPATGSDSSARPPTSPPGTGTSSP